MSLPQKKPGHVPEQSPPKRVKATQILSKPSEEDDREDNGWGPQPSGLTDADRHIPVLPFQEDQADEDDEVVDDGHVPGPNSGLDSRERAQEPGEPSSVLPEQEAGTRETTDSTGSSDRTQLCHEDLYVSVNEEHWSHLTEAHRMAAVTASFSAIYNMDNQVVDAASLWTSSELDAELKNEKISVEDVLLAARSSTTKNRKRKEASMSEVRRYKKQLDQAKIDESNS